MLFNIDKISDKFDSMTDFIPLYNYNSNNMSNIEYTCYINKNNIAGFSHFKNNEKECIILHFPPNMYPIKSEFLVCKENNPVAFNDLFKGLPDKLPKYDKSS
jgi:hypothetical protein